ncbi:hypothetical protein ACO2Q0_18600 [Phenylobacterium sp. VNQ135]
MVFTAPDLSAVWLWVAPSPISLIIFSQAARCSGVGDFGVMLAHPDKARAPVTDAAVHRIFSIWSILHGQPVEAGEKDLKNPR